MKTIEELKIFYEQTLALELRAMDAERRKTIHNALIGGCVVGFIILIIAAIAVSQGVPPIVFMIGLVAALVIGGVAFGYISKGYSGEYKRRIISKLITFLEPHLQYSPAEFISKEQFQHSNLFQNRIDRYRGEDLVRGRIGKTELVFSEVHAEYKTQSRDSKGRRHTHWHTIFKGLFFIADFNKDFHGQTLVLPDTAEKMFGKFGQTLQSWNSSRGELIRLEDPQFEKEFVVYGSDQIEARYILSTSLMERIKIFKLKSGVPIYLSFTGSKIYVGVAIKKNLFEPKLLSEAENFSSVLEYYEDLALAAGIVDDLNLNTRIWSKV